MSLILVIMVTVLGSSMGSHTMKEILKTDYCDLPCEEGKNAICLLGHCDASHGCKPIEMTVAYRHTIVDLHNKLRNFVASGQENMLNNVQSSNMMALSYDLELEYIAQCQVNECTDNSDPCRRSSEFQHVIQNIFVDNYRERDVDFRSPKYINFAVQAWKEDISKVKTRFLRIFPLHLQKNQFTAMIWAETTHIGCARAMIEGVSYFFCNYGPGGNIEGQMVFLDGEPCSKCPKNLSCNPQYPSLCGEVEPIPQEALSKTSGFRPKSLLFTILILLKLQ